MLFVSQGLCILKGHTFFPTPKISLPMRKFLLCIAVGMLFLTALPAQDQGDLYLIIELMRVDESQSNAYWETEQFWSKIHQQRANAGEIIGWDLWSLQPSGEDQGYQYMTVTLFKSFKDMISGEGNFQSHLKAAYPNMKEDELMKKFNRTSASRDLAIRLYMRQVASTQDDFSMPLGTFATMAVMQQLSDDYEDIEAGVFQPLHQAAIEAGQMGSWGLLRILFPAGSDRYASHWAVNMYKDAAQFAAYNMGDGESDMVTDLGVERGLESRDMKKVMMAKLEMKVRKQ